MTDSTVTIGGLPRPRRGLSELVLVEGSREAVWTSLSVPGQAGRVRAGVKGAGLAGDGLCMRCGGIVRPPVVLTYSEMAREARFSRGSLVSRFLGRRTTTAQAAGA